MCGIVAFYSKGGSISEDSLNRATKTLEHRGPDGQKVWISPNRKIGLGHARLSIIDLTSGDQPIANETNTIHIVVNGEFYDYERIQRELQQRGHQLRTKSDSEIALHLYEELGPGFAYHVGAAMGSATPTLIGALKDRGMMLNHAMALFIGASNLLVTILIWTGPETKGVQFAGADDHKAQRVQPEFH
jgi:glutamate synthase domain-containing protein 1